MIPVNTPIFQGNEKKYLNECIDTGWISSEGPFVKKFEDQIAKFIDQKYATACSNGSAALDLAVKALDLKLGDEVIMPSFTIISCAQSLVNQGVKPVLVDCHYDTFNMKAELIEPLITSKTKAIMIVHIYGLSVDIDPILETSKKYNLKIIEDAAEVIGLNYKGKKCGSFGDVTTLSFYPNKHITTGEGGMVLTNDPHIDKKLKGLRNLCFSPDSDKRFIHDDLGWNYRMTNIQAALGVAQFEQIDKFIDKKRQIGATYNKLLKGINSINLPIHKTSYCENIYWVYAITLKDDFEKNASQIITELSSFGIGARPFFYPMHSQPVFNKMGLFKDENHFNSSRLYEKGFYIPSGLGLTNDDMNEVSSILHKILN